MQRRFAVLVLALSLAPAARADDGRIEINQAMIQASGGFPYSISQPGSYVLTSDLVVADVASTAIVLSSGTLDLNGFAIRGPIVATRPPGSPYTPATFSWSATSSANGISAGGRVAIRNGRIVGFGRYGIDASGSATSPVTIEDVEVLDNAQGGISIHNGALRRVHVALNGGPGVRNCNCGDASTALVIEDSQIAYNLGDGLAADARISGSRISYNGGAGIKHDNAGGSTSLIVDNLIYRNIGKGIDAYGSYLGNLIYGNESSGGQVIGGMFDAGGNRIQ